MNMYKDHDEKIERIRHKKVQQKVQEALAQLKSKNHEEKKIKNRRQKKRIKFLSDNKTEIIDSTIRAVKGNIATNKTQRKEAREKMNKYFPPNDDDTHSAVGNINMCKYFPATETTVQYYKTATFNQRTGTPKDVCELVNPRWMYYHFNWSYLDMVRLRPKQWTNLPVGYNNNSEKVPPMFKKVIVKYNNQAPKDRTCLFDSLSSAMVYVYKNKFGGKLFN